MRRVIRLQYNSPVILTFAIASLGILFANGATGGMLNRLLFSVYRCPLSDIAAYPRFFLHVLGHTGWEHYLGNMMMILVVGPPIEEKYGSSSLLWAILVTAFVSGAIQWLFFPGYALCGASGIVFMLMVMLSLSGMRSGYIPITLLLVLALYLGGEIIDGFTLKDNVSQLTHIVGGICGAVLGLTMRK